MTTFKEQAETFLKQAANRKRNPLRANSLKTYKSQIETNLNPLIGALPLELVDNKAVKSIVSTLTERGLSPKTIQLNFSIIKKIRKSAQNDQGEEVYPYTWNSEFIDMPTDAAKTSTVSAQTIQDALANDCQGIGSIIAVLAGTGLRINEALALKMKDDGKSTVWVSAESKIIVREQLGGGATKTKAGEREVDLAPELNDFMLRTFPQADSPYLFILTEDAYRARILKCGIKGGFHTLRRFRTTVLNAASVPSGMEYFWMGHAAKDVHGRYVNVGEEIQRRKQEAARVGLGFKLPEAVWGSPPSRWREG